jgi:VWFA-related protein
MPKFPPGIFSNYVATPTNQAVNILLMDALNTPMQDQAYLRQQLLEYLKSARPGTNTAIFGLSTKLVMLQGFTSDTAILKNAVERVNSGTSPLLDSPLGGTMPGGGGGMPDTAQDIADNSLTQLSAPPPSRSDPAGSGSATAPGASPADITARLQTFMDIQNSFELMLRARYTLDGMNVLARYLASIPGRKNLIWFSGSFPLDVLPDVTDNPSSPFRGVANAEDEYRDTTNLLARSQVAVYPIDARGVLSDPVMAASNPGTKYARSNRSIVNDEQKFNAQTVDEHSTMTRMADDTGGRAFYNTNGLVAAVDKAIEDGSNFYTITYSPTNTVWKGDFRKIQVKLAKSGYTLEYRHHYYADDPNSATSAIAADRTHDASLIDKAMEYGVPCSTQLLFKVRVLPLAGEPSADLAPENLAGGPKQSQSNAPYRNYGIDFAVVPTDISWQFTPDGIRRASVEFISIVYQPDGTAVTQTSHILNVALNPEQYRRIQVVGFPFHQVVSVPVKGSYSIRTAAHDLRTNRMGTTELSIASVRNLPPAVTAASKPAP